MTNRRTTLLVLALAVLAALVVYFVGRSRSRLPGPGSAQYEQTVRSFYHGLASLQVGLLDDAKREFGAATELVPAEPASWANLGLAHLRLGEFDAASQSIERAAAEAPANSNVAFLQARLEASRGRLDEGIRHLRRALDLDGRNLKARAALAEELERSGGQDADAQAQELLNALLEQRPNNLAVLLERARLAAKRGDAALLQDSVTRLGARVAAWPPVAAEQYDAFRRAVEARNFTDAARAVAFLRNVLVRVPEFLESLAEVRVPSELLAEPFDRFVKLLPPPASASPPDDALTFTRELLEDASSVPAAALAAFSLNGTDLPVVFATDGGNLRRVGAPGPPLVAVPISRGLLPVDWNRDFKMDLAVAGRGGLRLFAQTNEGTFTDITAQAAGADVASLRADCSGVWAADIEMDGDLDLVVGLTGAAPLVLRNNGDGTWRTMRLFGGGVGVRAFGWGDIDRDGDPDAVLLDAQGSIHLFENRQGGQFREMPGPRLTSRVLAFTLGDPDADGVLDLVMLDAGGSMLRAYRDGDGWHNQLLAAWSDRPDGSEVGALRLVLADLDNNGALDLIASGPGRSRIWLGGGQDRFQPLAAAINGEVFAVVDLNGDGQLDMAVLEESRPVRLLGHGSKGYHWKTFRPRAQAVAGDQRINSFGVGGEIEIRSGLLVQKQLLTGAPAHFGLGVRTGVDVVRIVWPNGIMQADFESRADEAVLAEQRLKGSCPWVFTYDGSGMRFVTDFLWRSPLGLRINAQDTAGVTQTEDWVKIRGDQLVAAHGLYDVRMTAELWETHFVDHLSLMVVDHPDALDVFVDERFSQHAPALATHAMTKPQAVAHAWDETGRDVTDLVARQDGRYLATFERGEYQGVATDHFVEVELAGETRAAGHRWLVANGWIYPTDSSINVAIGQGSHVQPRGLSLEAQEEAGRWIVVSPDLGFPAGKNKTILIDLDNVARAGVTHARRLRLRTNLEVYWDWLAVADAAENAPGHIMRISPEQAELRYRGFSKTSYAQRDAPELPRYGELANITQRWRDLVGYYTRFGDVRELLAAVDDRYVIMNAGDELRLLFPELEPPPDGWTRDFVLIGDGWVKDGDYNTSFSKMVGPLPEHGRPDYEGASGPSGAPELEDDPVYRRHPLDWQTYHTRFVSPRGFLGGLR